MATAKRYVVCSYCLRVVRAQSMMGRLLRTGDRYRAATHGPTGERCGGSGRPMESTSNMRLTEAQRDELARMEANAAR